MSSPTSNTTLTPTGHRRRRGFLSFVLLLVWLAALGLIALNREPILDWVKLHNYEPPAAVSTLASQDTMTGYGRKIFYINRPDIESKGQFSKSCPNNGGEQTIVLGCYRAGESGIYLLDVNDARLDGVMQVTAAHEMLHGAYERLSDTDRKQVDAMLMDYYDNGLTDQRIRDTIDAYKKSEPNDVVNEMHSVFGTEVAHLPDNLEQYYKRYFTDRMAVAGFAAQYQAQFTSRQAQIDDYDARLATLKGQITGMESDLQAKQAQIDAAQSQLNAQRRSGDVDGYNAGVPAYNTLIGSYNDELQTLKRLISQYNDLVKQRNDVAFEEDQLVKSLSTDAAPIQ